MNTDRSERKAVGLIIITCVLWSTGGLFIKMVPWHPVVIAGFRSLIAAAVAYFYMRRVKLRVVVNKNSVLSGFFLCGLFFLFVGANKLTTAANAIVLQYCSPVFVLLISAVFYKQKFCWQDILAVTITIGGIALFFFDELSEGGLLGNVFALLGGVFCGAMYVITAHADADSRLSGILLGNVAAALIGIPFAFFVPTPVTVKAVFFIFCLGFFQLGLPYVLFGIAAKRCGALVISMIGAVEPLLNPFWVFLATGEAPGMFAFIGGAIVLLTITIWGLWQGRRAVRQAKPVVSA